MHPFIPLLASHLLFLIVPFLPVSSFYRPLIVIIILSNCAMSLGSIDPELWWSEEFALYVCGVGLYSNYLVNICKLTAPPKQSRIQTLTWGLQRCFDPRFGIAIEHLPSFRVGDARFVPRRARFLMQRIWTLAWTVGGYLLFRRHRLDLYLDDFQSPKDQIIRRLAHVSAREWMVLFQMAFLGWFMPYCVLTASHSLASVVAVACGDEPRNWRPLFGDIREAYSVQRFFGWVDDIRMEGSGPLLG